MLSASALTKFQERDNILRECRVAQDYWQLELEHILAEEGELSHEQRGPITCDNERIKLQEQQQELMELLKNIRKNINDEGSGEFPGNIIGELK